MRSGVIQGKFVCGQPKVPTPRPQPTFRPAADHVARVAAARQRTVQPSMAGGAMPIDQAALRLPGGGGRPLPETVRRHMEEVFGAGLADVRIHEGPQAPALGAVAFTLGSEIHFAPGHFVPGTGAGRQLLGHEIAHVLQQRAGRVRNPLGPGLVVIQDPALEAEAERMGLHAAQVTPQRPSPAILPAAGIYARAGARESSQRPGVAQLMKRKAYGKDDWIDYGDGDSQPTKKHKVEKRGQNSNKTSKTKGTPTGWTRVATGNYAPVGYQGNCTAVEYAVYGPSGDFFGLQFDYVYHQPFVPNPVSRPLIFDAPPPKVRKKPQSRIPLGELEWNVQNLPTLPSIPKLPRYLKEPIWGSYNDLAGGTSVHVVLGPTGARGLTNAWGAPGTIDCTSVNDLNATNVLGYAWVKGHLLNAELGGPSTSENLTPLTHQGNMNFKRFETVLKHAIAWCRKRADEPLDEYFYGVEFGVEVVGKRWPTANGALGCVAQHVVCKMKYAKQKRTPPNGAILALDHTDPTPSSLYPDSAKLAQFSSQTYACT